MSTLQQIRKIHTLKNLLCMSDEVYKKHLRSFDAASSKNLTEVEADILISIFDKKVKALHLKNMMVLLVVTKIWQLLCICS